MRFNKATPMEVIDQALREKKGLTYPPSLLDEVLALIDLMINCENKGQKVQFLRIYEQHSDRIAAMNIPSLRRIAQGAPSQGNKRLNEGLNGLLTKLKN